MMILANWELIGFNNGVIGKYFIYVDHLKVACCHSNYLYINLIPDSNELNSIINSVNKFLFLKML